VRYEEAQLGCYSAIIRALCSRCFRLDQAVPHSGQSADTDARQGDSARLSPRG